MKPIWRIYCYKFFKNKKKNTDTDEKNNTEVSVFQYVFEIRSISI